MIVLYVQGLLTLGKDLETLQPTIIAASGGILPMLHAAVSTVGSCDPRSCLLYASAAVGFGVPSHLHGAQSLFLVLSYVCNDRKNNA